LPPLVKDAEIPTPVALFSTRNVSTFECPICGSTVMEYLLSPMQRSRVKIVTLAVPREQASQTRSARQPGFFICVMSTARFHGSMLGEMLMTLHGTNLGSEATLSGCQYLATTSRPGDKTNTFPGLKTDWGGIEKPISPSQNREMETPSRAVLHHSCASLPLENLKPLQALTV